METIQIIKSNIAEIRKLIVSGSTKTLRSDNFKGITHSCLRKILNSIGQNKTLAIRGSGDRILGDDACLDLTIKKHDHPAIISYYLVGTLPACNISEETYTLGSKEPSYEKPLGIMLRMFFRCFKTFTIHIDDAQETVHYEEIHTNGISDICGRVQDRLQTPKVWRPTAKPKRSPQNSVTPLPLPLNSANASKQKRTRQQVQPATAVRPQVQPLAHVSQQAQPMNATRSQVQQVRPVNASRQLNIVAYIINAIILAHNGQSIQNALALVIQNMPAGKTVKVMATLDNNTPPFYALTMSSTQFMLQSSDEKNSSYPKQGPLTDPAITMFFTYFKNFAFAIDNVNLGTYSHPKTSGFNSKDLEAANVLTSLNKRKNT